MNLNRQRLTIPFLPTVLAVASCVLTPIVTAQSASAAQFFQPDLQQAAVGKVDIVSQSWQESRQQSSPTKKTQEEIAALEKRGTTALNRGYYREAIVDLEALLSLIQDLQLVSTQAITLSNLGIAHKNLGNYNQAAKLQRQAGSLIVKLSQLNQGSDRAKSRQVLGQILLNLGNAEEAQGNYKQAQQAYQQSLNLATETGDRIGESLALNNLGSIYSTLGNYKKAINYLTQSLQISKEINSQSLQASTLLTIGSIHHFCHDSTYVEDSICDKSDGLKTAIRHYQESLSMAKVNQDITLQAEALSSLGIAYEDLKDYNRAIEFHQKSVNLATTISDPELQAKSLNNLGHTLFAAQKLPQAAASLRKAIALLDGLRFGLTDKYKVSIFDTQIHIYNLLQQILIADQQPESALEISEQGRARAFAELLAQRQNNLDSSLQLAPINLAQIRQIVKQQKATVVEYAIVPDDDFKFRGKQRGKEAKLFIWVIHPTGKIDFRQVNLVALWSTKGTLSQIIATARCLDPNCPTAEEVAATRGIKISTVKPSAAAHSATPKTINADTPIALTYPGLPELHQLLIQPIADLLPKNANDPVIFIPQESLFLVPFAALPDAKGKYLIESHTILSAPSIQVLGLTQHQVQKVRGKNIKSLVVGNPQPLPEGLDNLPNAEQEAIEVAKILNTSAIIGKQATKDEVVKQFGNARVIHLATHGLLELGQSSSLEVPGAIVLASSNPQQNGLLTAEEIIRLYPRLKAELVVLSACDTGRGIITGDGVLGLSRSWIAAGAPSVVVSLWQVQDKSTAALMVDFYKLKQQSDDRSGHAAALRQAMLNTMKKYPAPNEWAAFILVGQ
jgi:CHAT domain-containing protein